MKEAMMIKAINKAFAGMSDAEFEAFILKIRELREASKK